MAKKNPTDSTLSPKAMEMVMRDVLRGMEDLVTMKSFESINNVFEIVSISPAEKCTLPGRENTNSNNKTNIVPFYRKQNPEY